MQHHGGSRQGRTGATAPGPTAVRAFGLLALVCQPKLTASPASTYIDGMSHGMGLAEAASGADPAAGLQAARELRELAERLEALQGQTARKHGWAGQGMPV